MGKMNVPGIGKIGTIKDMRIETLKQFSEGVISGAILDSAAEVVYTLKDQSGIRVKKAKFDGEWARKTTERYTGDILNDPNTLITLDKKFCGPIYFRQRSPDNTEAYYEIKRWKEKTTEVEEEHREE